MRCVCSADAVAGWLRAGFDAGRCSRFLRQGFGAACDVATNPGFDPEGGRVLAVPIPSALGRIQRIRGPEADL